MQPNETIDISGPKTLILSPQTIAVILDALAEKPYKTSNGPINEIISQLRTSPDKPGSQADRGGGEDGILGKGDVKANGHDGRHREQTG